MRNLSFIFITIIALFFLESCTSPGQPNALTTANAANFMQRQSIVPTTKRFYAAKDPTQVALYKHQKPMTPYRVIGIATVSKYNLIGIPRNDMTLQEMMQKLAASIGGDALINFNDSKDTVQAHVIQFQKILL